MSSKPVAGVALKTLIGLLASPDGAVRQDARLALVARGHPAVPPLIRVLQQAGEDHVRWEAAKALGAIGDPRSIPALVKALEDRNPDVAWLAAEGLRGFHRQAWLPLLRALSDAGPRLGALRHGAHHVLLHRHAPGLEDELAALMKALEPAAVPESAMVAAHALLKRLRDES